MLKRFLESIFDFVDFVIEQFRRVVNSSRADKLLLAAFIVATLRQMGVNGHFIGYDPASQWGWFEPFEVFSGIAMALLEGVALAYVSRRWRRLDPKTWQDWTYWSILLVGQLVMLFSVVFYVALYAHAAQRGTEVAIYFSEAWNMTWNFAVAGVNPLIAILVGIVDDEAEESTDVEVVSEEDEAWLTLLEMIKEEDANKVIPEELAMRANISNDAARRVIVEAAKLGMFK